MRTFLVIISIFIGIFSYNMYVPSQKDVKIECGEKDFYPHVASPYVRDLMCGYRMEGTFVAFFFSGMCWLAMNSLLCHIERKREG